MPSFFQPIFAQAAAAANNANAVAPGAVPWYQETWFQVLAAVAVLVVPYLIGNALAKSIRMVDYGWKIGLILVAVCAGFYIDILMWPPHLGIDLSGGVKLIYQIDTNQLRNVNVDKLIRILADEARKANYGTKLPEVREVGNGDIEVRLPSADPDKANLVEQNIGKLNLMDAPQTPLGITLAPIGRREEGKSLVLSYQVNRSAQTVDMDKLVKAISQRVNPGGQREVAIRTVGSQQIEVAIPNVDKSEIDQIKRLIATAGSLEFRIVAQAPDDNAVIDLAQKEIDNPSNDVSDGERVVARWADLDPNVTPQRNWVLRPMHGTTQVLLLMDDYDVTGAFLDRASSGVSDKGLAVDFSFKPEGAQRFGELTAANLPQPNGFRRELAVVLDNTLKSAPWIESRITDHGQITGITSQTEVDFVVSVLNAGSLPAALEKQPISEERISPELGADTIKSSAWAMAVSTGAVLIFMLFYYRFAGIVADACVLLNLVLVLALMIIFKAAFTLSGLAGLVLSVGMAVDSNVLIYERMREEKERGAQLRMVIRNGFGRAMATIIDTHSTTIITGVILYVIGTEQLRGFAVTLVMGLVVNLFTAVFCGRVVFDVAERQKLLTKLKMMRLFGDTSIDFVRITKPAIAVSILISVAGIVACFARGGSMLDVDFTGGSSVQVVFNEPTDVNNVRKKLEQPDVVKELPDATVYGVTTAEGKPNTQFIIRTSNTQLDEVKDKLAKVFGSELRHYKPPKISDIHVIEAKKTGGPPPGGFGPIDLKPMKPTPPTVPAPTAPPAEKAAEKTGDKAPEKASEPAKAPDDKTKAAPAPDKGSNLFRLDRALVTLAAPRYSVLSTQYLVLAADGDNKTPDNNKTAADAKVPEIKTTDARAPDTKTPDTKTPDTKTPSAKLSPSAGALEFRIVADRVEDKAIAELAKKQIENPSNEVTDGEKVVARWANLDKNEQALSHWLTRQRHGATQMLLLMDPYNVTGAYLNRVTSAISERGLAVNFSFNPEGATRFGKLTAANLPQPKGLLRCLAIVLDNTVKSAPFIESRITDQVQISGNFSQAEVDQIVAALRAGAVPKDKPATSDTKPALDKGSNLFRLDRALVAFAARPYSVLSTQYVVLAADGDNKTPDNKSTDKTASPTTTPPTTTPPTTTTPATTPPTTPPSTTTSSTTPPPAATPPATTSPTVPPPATPPTSPGEAGFAAPTSSFVGGTEATIEFDPSEAIKYDSLKEQLLKIFGPELSKSLKKDVQFDLSNPDFVMGSSRAFSKWTIKVNLPRVQATPQLDKFAEQLAATPVFLSDSKIGPRVANDTRATALYALGASIIMIVVYIWIRFQNVIFGLGAVVALVHDVLVTVAGVALSYYVAGFLGFLLIDPFKISLNVVAAMLTIVGYSISDTIVIFDRIREVRGKSPDLTEEMINVSVNQTLSRTVLTVFTVLLVTTILFIWGGEAIHAFAFTMLIGLISGTYSSVYIAAPVLLWLKLPGKQE